MALFFMMGRYSAESLTRITARRTEEAVGLIEKLNGQVTAMYALLGPFDIILVVNLPGVREAMEASVGLAKLTGVQFTTCPAITMERFDEMVDLDLKRFFADGKK